MRLTALTLAATLLLATPALAQDFLGAIGRRAAEAVAARAAERVFAPRAPAPGEPGEANTPASRGARRASVAPNPYADLQALPEEQRDAACRRRVAPEGRFVSVAHESQFVACMGPGYGDGG